LGLKKLQPVLSTALTTVPRAGRLAQAAAEAVPARDKASRALTPNQMRPSLKSSRTPALEAVDARDYQD